LSREQNMFSSLVISIQTMYHKKARHSVGGTSRVNDFYCYRETPIGSKKNRKHISQRILS